jgi:hypothetical protein
LKVTSIQILCTIQVFMQKMDTRHPPKGTHNSFKEKLNCTIL